MPGQTTPLCEYLAWDSEFFEFRIARVGPQKLSAQNAAAVVDWCEAEHIDCLYLLVQAGETDTISLAERHAFRLVDVRITLSLSLGQQALEGDSQEIRAAMLDDIPKLQALARQSHHDSRFYADPNFGQEKCDLLYATWIEKSLRGYADVVFVADAGNGPCGYITCKAIGDVSQIGLLAVDPDVHGRGLASRLITTALDWSRQRGCRHTTVVTQGRNIPAQRCYQRNGFMTSEVALWYHRWFRQPARPESKNSE